MKAKIFKPAKSAMQSGRAGNKSWKLVLEDGSHQSKDPLIGYYGGSNTSSQINLFFTKEFFIIFSIFINSLMMKFYLLKNKRVNFLNLY